MTIAFFLYLIYVYTIVTYTSFNVTPFVCVNIIHHNMTE